MLQIEHVSKQYKTGDFVQQALDDVSVNLRDNEFVAILGPSGSGKTTLLNIIGGLDRYDSGDLIINGTSTKKYKDRDWDSYRNHTVGFVFQSYNLIPHQTILSNVELALTISGVSRKERHIRAVKALEQVGLGEHVNKRPNQLSGGQMQRVAIARALVNNPSILLADEPTGALDSETSVQIMDLLKEVAKDRLVVMVTHNPELAHQYATRIVELHDGVILSDSNPVVEEEVPKEQAQHRTFGKASMGLLTSLSLSFNNLRTKKARTLLTSFAGSIGIIGIALILSVSTGVNRYIDNIQRETMTSYPITIQEQSFDLNKIMDSAQESEKEAKSHKDLKAIYPDDSSIKGASSLTSSITQNNLTGFKKYLDNPKSEIHQYVGSVGIQYSYDTKFAVFGHDPEGKLVSADKVTMGAQDTGSAASQMASANTNSDMGDIQSMQMSHLTGKTDKNKAPEIFGEIMPGADAKTTISKVVTDNYQVVDGSWPKAKDQVVLVLDKNNQIPVTSLYKLGVLPSNQYSDIMSKLNSGQEVETDTSPIDYSKVMQQKLSMVPAADQYVKGDDGHYRYIGDNADEMAKVADKAMPLQIVGVVRPNEDAKATPLKVGVGYTRQLTDYLIDQAKTSPIVTDQEADQDHSVLNGMAFAPADDAAKASDAKDYIASLGVSQKASMAQGFMSGSSAGVQMGAGSQGSAATAPSEQASASGAMAEQQTAQAFDQYIATAPQDVLVAIYNQYVSTGTYADNLSDFGMVSRNAPSRISIYTDSFENKNSVGDAIKHYNDKASEKNKIVYTDYVGLMMNSVTTIINVITYVLIAFVGVSLVVSSIMIGIITYISVLERTKEIGILRAMGASKRNVSNVFNAETGIIGLLAGLLGVGITLLLIIPANSIMHHFMGTTEVNAALPVSGGVALVVLSVVLTLIGGLIPSRKAAKQDPATALRTE
ncbi:ABC transporter ATP-binding protein/permease [Bifidobacterium coryneforme]|uniref:ABC-type antimicrobial peptide transport system, ATPase component n=1 Tax=Bifidobacterium [indicum] DSM 20214 = LMG 11587 TaxID=1341694 RepID=A0A087VSF6_9BIFI|nr:ABC transporter ATP-binding protein/permease [Bifidobacterium indicum]AIC91290.1 ABC-type antimicrobial peptide transport system, ATPase component [Bifidobacterium indicum LMG 11587 = DSM 20214]